MPFRMPTLLFFLAAAGSSLSALSAEPPAVSVQSRTLVIPKMRPGAETPMNTPEEGAVKLPFVTGGLPGVARRINEAIWREMLDGAAAPTAPGKTFTPPPDKLPEGTTSLEFTARFIPASAPRILSLDFSGEGCGAYCEDFTATHLFDLRDGREILLGDLLSVEGFAAVGRRVDAQRRRAYQEQIRALQAAKKSSRGAKKAEQDDDEDRLTLNQDCLKQIDSEPSTPRWLVADVFSLDGHGGLAVSVGRCSNHAMRALDDVGEISVAIPAAELKAALTPYGLYVVRQEGEGAAPPSNFDGRELHGRVGGLPVTMKLEPLRAGADTAGWYAYDKYRTPIALTVRQEGGALHASEKTETQGRFELSANGGTLTGTWSDKSDRKRLPVILQ